MCSFVPSPYLFSPLFPYFFKLTTKGKKLKCLPLWLNPMSNSGGGVAEILVLATLISTKTYFYMIGKRKKTRKMKKKGRKDNRKIHAKRMLRQGKSGAEKSKQTQGVVNFHICTCRNSNFSMPISIACDRYTNKMLQEIVEKDS
jgi:hypothetical protein